MNQLGLLTELGSTWHRWDPHIHAPGTRLEDGYKDDWDSFIERLESSEPPIRALGVTDYCGIGGYQQVKACREAGRLENVEVIFPNVEFRLSLETGKGRGINLHLLFSPDDPEHERQIERILRSLHFKFGETNYNCTQDDLIELGRKFDPSQRDPNGAARVGANQFKVNLDQLIELYQEKWFSKNCLIAVAGSKNDGTAGLQGASFAATRQKIESFSHIIFSGTPKQRDFWLGKGALSVDQLEARYGGRKVCLHGSDAHRIEKIDDVDLARYCWIKGALTFDSLRQVCLEPETRAWIGSSPPSPISPSYCIKSVSVQHAPWLANDKVILNDGLVAIVGERGSGKTALLDIIAQGAGALARPLATSSFIKKASPLLGKGTVTIEWGDGREEPIPLLDGPSDGKPFVKYLSQQFVERLCSAEGVATELREEIERVIFDSTPFEDRLAADTFDALRCEHLDAIHRRRTDLEREVRELGERMESEKSLVDALADKQTELAEAKKRIELEEKEQLELVPEGKKERAEALSRLLKKS